MNFQNKNVRTDTLVRYLPLNFAERQHLTEGAQKIAEIGGPDASASAALAETYALKIRSIMNPAALSLLDQYGAGELCALVMQDLDCSSFDAVPDQLPELNTLETDERTLFLSSRSQILLALANNKSFAYDIDNEGRVARLVANFKGGGVQKLAHEVGQPDGLSSHHGIALGLHTEAPYFATGNHAQGHSPAPSTLILTARWNPLNEPTTIVPLRPLLNTMDGATAIGLSLPAFGFTRSDSFVEGKGDAPDGVSVLDVDEQGNVNFKYNAYRTYLMDDAPVLARSALANFNDTIGEAAHVKISLNNSTAVLINNYAALHGRDVVEDNRRLLIRLFGYSNTSSYLPITENPLVVTG